MRKSPEGVEFIGDKETFNRQIKDMARAMNSDGAYGAFAGQTMHIDGLYYNRTFAQHLNMAYDRPIWITLKINSPKQEDNPTRRIRSDYTFLHD